MEETIAHMELMLERRESSSESTEESTRGIGLRFKVFPHTDGVLRKIPPDWDWPNLTMRHAYVYWHCGNPASQIAPMKLLEKKDFAGKLKARGVRTHGELKRLMTAIDNTAMAKGVVPKKLMT